jgi:lambda repressor-like predicted transcriptional regulator
MSHLAVQVQAYLSQPGITATALELKAGLKRGTLDSIQREQHPRPERLGQLIRALDDATARRWLIAYLRDDCPPEYLPRLQILITELDGSTVPEPVSPYLVTLEHGAAAVLAAGRN